MWSLSQLLSSVPMRQSRRPPHCVNTWAWCVSLKLYSQKSCSLNLPILIYPCLLFSFTIRLLKRYHFYCHYFSFFFKLIIIWVSPSLLGGEIIFQPIPHFTSVPVIGTFFRVWQGSQFLPTGLTPILFSEFSDAGSSSSTFLSNVGVVLGSASHPSLLTCHFLLG